MMAQNGINPEATDFYKNVISPLCFIAGSTAGLMNKPRTATTIAMFGTAAVGASFAGVASGEFEVLPVIFSGIGLTGQYFGSYFAPDKNFEPAKEQKLKTRIGQYPFVKSTAVQLFVGSAILCGTFIANMKDIIPSAFIWLAGDVIKAGWAVSNAQSNLKQQQSQPIPSQ